jgi:hypothetical protein
VPPVSAVSRWKGPRSMDVSVAGAARPFLGVFSLTFFFSDQFQFYGTSHFGPRLGECILTQK